MTTMTMNMTTMNMTTKTMTTTVWLWRLWRRRLWRLWLWQGVGVGAGAGKVKNDRLRQPCFNVASSIGRQKRWICWLTLRYCSGSAFWAVLRIRSQDIYQYGKCAETCLGKKSKLIWTFSYIFIISLNIYKYRYKHTVWFYFLKI